MRAKDSNIRQALLDLYGGDKRKAIGIKAEPGPLYGIKSHMWAALGVAVIGGGQVEAADATASFHEHPFVRRVLRQYDLE